MPVYEYRCTKCEKEFEYQQRMSDPPMAVCEACGGELERLISRTAFQLKGGGWYKDLYSSSKPETKSTEATSTEAKSTDAKPAESTKTDKPSGGGDSGGSTGSGTGSGSGTASGSGTGSGSSGGSGSGGSSASTAAA